MKKHTYVKKFCIIAGELLTIGTILFLLAIEHYNRLPLGFGTLILVMLPLMMERIFKCEICLPVYIFAVLYAVGPMMGQCWNFYYTISWWDKLLHTCGGVMFAVVGAYFFEIIVKKKDLFLARIIFALCFSITLAVLWEFIEFGSDRLFGTDMQDDVLITHLTSYLLGEGIGVTGNIESIQSVQVNDVLLPGYIDIGLTDSMMDMMLESLGAVISCLLMAFDKGRHSLIKDRCLI